MNILLFGSREKPPTLSGLFSGFDPGEIAFTRASTGTHFNKSGLLVSAAIDTPRFEYDPVTHVYKGLLYEEAAQNVLRYSNDFSQSAWAKIGVSLASGQGTAPDGNNTLWGITRTATTNSHVYQSIANPTVGQTITISRFVKAGNVAFCTLGLHALDDCYFDLNNLTYAWKTAGGGRVSASIEDVGNGVRKVTATWTAQSTGNNRAYFAVASSLSSGGGAVGDYLYTWGHQLIINGPNANSYVATSATAVTRATDALQFTVPDGTLQYVFDDNTTQDVVVTAGAYTVPTTLNRSRIKQIKLL